MAKRAVLCAFAILCAGLMIGASFLCLTDNTNNSGTGDLNIDATGIEENAFEQDTETAELGSKVVAYGSNGEKICKDDDFKVEGITYLVTDENNVRVNDYDGRGYFDGKKCLSVPDTVEYKGRTFTVNEITNRGLSSTSMFAHFMEEIEIGPYVEKIDTEAMSCNCANKNCGIEKFTIRNIEDSKLWYIGKDAFQCCIFTSITLPNTVEYIGVEAFSSCKQLVTVNFVGESNKELRIDEYAFDSCDSLENIDLTRATTIDDCAFNSCDNLKEVNMPAVTEICYDMFYHCLNLEVVIAPNATSIHENAFENCRNLRTVIAPNVKSIDGDTFEDCEKLVKLDLRSVAEVPAKMFKNDFKELETVIFTSATKVGKSAFEGCVKLKNVDISSATYIDSYCFKNCDSLEKIDLKSVTYVSYQSFAYCDNLKEVNMPAAYHITSEAFYNVTTLTNVVFSDQFREVSADAFNKIKFYVPSGSGLSPIDITAENLKGKTFGPGESPGTLVQIV